MKRGVVIALAVGLGVATAWSQPGDDPSLKDPFAHGSGSAAGSGSAMGSGGGSAMGSGAGSAMGSGAGSGSASKRKPIAIILPPEVTAPEVSAAASPSQVRLGERFTLFITATYVQGVEVNLREPLDVGEALEVKRKVSQDRVGPDGRHVREWQIEVFAWELGDLRVPELAVTFTSQGKAGQVATNTVPIRVFGVLGDVVDDPKLMRGDAPPVRLFARDWFWLWLGLGVVGALFAIGLFLYIRRRRRRRVRSLIGTLVASVPVARRIDMTSERALQRLLAIEKSGVLDRDEDRKQGYTEMVEVIRDYLGARYHVATNEMTSAELLRSLDKAAPADEKKLVEDWLDRCDFVKYGGFRATGADAHSVLAAARALVMATTRLPGESKPPEAEPPPANPSERVG